MGSLVRRGILSSSSVAPLPPVVCNVSLTTDVLDEPLFSHHDNVEALSISGQTAYIDSCQADTKYLAATTTFNSPIVVDWQGKRMIQVDVDASRWGDDYSNPPGLGASLTIVKNPQLSPTISTVDRIVVSYRLISGGNETWVVDFDEAGVDVGSTSIGGGLIRRFGLIIDGDTGDVSITSGSEVVVDKTTAASYGGSFANLGGWLSGGSSITIVASPMAWVGGKSFSASFLTARQDMTKIVGVTDLHDWCGNPL